MNEMGLYNFSSTDSKHYNRIQVSVPNHFLSGYCNVCVSTFTSNCNIEVMNENDYIEFLIGTDKTKVFMESHSKLTPESLPDVLQAIFDKHNVKITCSCTNINTISFVCDTEFAITDMTYNMRLITGYYCIKDEDLPIRSIPYTETVLRDNNQENVALDDISFDPVHLRLNDYRPLVKTLTPKNASGFSIQYGVQDDNIVVVDETGFITAIGLGTTKIIAEVRNFDSSIYVKPDFTCEISVIVEEAQAIEITDVQLPQAITIKENEVYTIYPKITPYNSVYVESWESSNPDIATVRNGYIRGVKAGECNIKYKLVSLDSSHRTFDNIYVKITILSEYHDITRYRIISDSVGYMLSTPILYLLTNVGNSIFYNEMRNQKKLQCGTVCMCLNNSYSASYPIIAQQAEITTKCAINATSDIYFILVDANMREVKLLNPMYITVQITAVEGESITPGVGLEGISG